METHVPICPVEIEESKIGGTIIKHSDLEKGFYEGGFKVWECERDLLEYIQNSHLELEEKSVLELGCGQGLVGIFCLLKGAEVYFQDFNKEVIEKATKPAIEKNLMTHERPDLKEKAHYLYGDWGNIGEMREEGFDFIFAADTIYQIESYASFVKAIKQGSGSKSCLILIAAKR